MLTRKYLVRTKVSGAHEKVCREHEKVSGAQEKVSGSHEKVCRAHEKLSGAHEKVSGAHTKECRAHEKVSSNRQQPIAFRFVSPYGMTVCQ